MRYFCKAFDVYRNPRNVSKISADISDNALSLLKIENYERYARGTKSRERETPDTQPQSISRLPRETRHSVALKKIVITQS